MRLDAIAVELRPRTAWEAADLGAVMVRHWVGPVYRAWFALALPLFLLLHLLCWGRWWLIPWLLWWLKPLLDRPPLYVLGHALFGDAPDRYRFWRELPALLRCQALAALTFRRFDPARSFNLPVTQLEGLSGLARRQRLRDLGRPGRGPAVWLTVVCAHLEIALDFALLALAWMLIPEFVALDFFDLLDDSSAWGQLWLNAVGFCGMSLVEPFYVGAGFALYLNRRTWLEAWDLELGFRRLAARLARAGRAAAGLLLALGLSGLAAASGESFAAEVSTPVERRAPAIQSPCEQRRAREAELAGSPSPVKRALAEIMGEPELQICATEERWRFRDDDRPDGRVSPGSPEEGRARWFAAVVEHALWFALGMFLAVAGWGLWRQVPRPRGARQPRAAAVKVPLLLGRNERVVPPDSELGTAAWRLWSAGQPREALGLLYQGSLTGLATRHGLPVAASATEEDCLHLAAAQLRDPELLGFFRQLTRAWQATAYAHRPPDEADAWHLCEQWSRHFAAVREPLA